MTGAANSERIDSYIVETTPGTTPATPAFTKLSVTEFNMSANPRITEPRLQAFGTQRSGIGRHGNAVAGSLRSPLLYGELDDFFASLFQDTWDTDVITNGTEDQVSMTVEQSIPAGAGSATINYLRYKGVEASGGQLILTAGAEAEMTFDLIGFDSDDAASSAIAGSSYADPTNTNVLGSGSDIGTIALSGMTIDCMSNLTIDWGGAEKDSTLR